MSMGMRRSTEVVLGYDADTPLHCLRQSLGYPTDERRCFLYKREDCKLNHCTGWCLVSRLISIGAERESDG